MSEVPTKTVPIDSISPHPENYNRHPESQIVELVESAESFGQYKNVVTWSPDSEIDLGNGQKLYPDISYLLAGHGFWLASRQAGRDTIEVKDYTGLPYEDALLLMKVDNAAPLGAQPDPEKLKALLAKTRERAVDRPKLGAMLARLKESAGVSENGESPKDAPDPQVDKAAQLQEKWGTRLGQVWSLGEHRLAVGDCTDRAVVEAVMRGEQADCMITDPPYMTTDLKFDKEGVNWEWCSLWKDYTQQNGYLALFAPVILLAQTADLWAMRFSGAWVKPAGGMRTHSAKKPMCQSEPYAVFAHPNHKISELVWNDILHEGEPYKKVQRNTGYKRGGKDQLDRSNTSTWTKDGFISINNGTREQTDVLWGANKPYMAHGERTQHPTQKPIECILVMIQWLTNLGAIVCDPFLGSGTTLIACENLKRKCRVVELDPGYAGVAIQRWADLAHQDPVLLGE